MTATQYLLLALLAIVVVAITFGVALVARRSVLRRRFGPEYDRVVADIFLRAKRGEATAEDLRQPGGPPEPVTRSEVAQRTWRRGGR